MCFVAWFGFYFVFQSTSVWERSFCGTKWPWIRWIRDLPVGAKIKTSQRKDQAKGRKTVGLRVISEVRKREFL